MQSYCPDLMSFSAEEFCQCVSSGDESSADVAYFLIHKRLRNSLGAIYYANDAVLIGELDDTLDDFFLYLHGGINGHKPFERVRTIQCPESFFQWVESAYLFFLLNGKREERQRQRSYMEETDTHSSVSHEKQILAIATAIAYCDQTSLPENRFLVFRWLLSQLEPKRSMGNEVVAKSLHISHVAYRVQTHRLKTKLVNDVKYLVAGGTLPLDEEHQAMRDSLSDRFEQLYGELYKWYEKSIENHPLREELLALDRNDGHLHENPCEWPSLYLCRVLFSDL